MNKPLTVSLEGIGQCVLHPDILFPLQSSPHTLHSSCPPNTTGSWAGKHWGPSLHPSWSHQLLPSLLPKAPMLSAPVHIPRFAELLLASALQTMCGSSATTAAVFHKFLPTLLRTWSPPHPGALHQPDGWGAAVLHGPGKAILFHPHLQLLLSVGPEINLLHFDFTFSPFLSPGWDGSLMLF